MDTGSGRRREPRPGTPSPASTHPGRHLAMYNRTPMEPSGRCVIAVLGGSGAEGRGLALRWAAAGYPVVIGSRDAARASAAAEAIGAALAGVAGSARPTGTDNLAAARAADVVVLAVPYAAQDETLEAVAGVLAGRILLTVVVPLRPPKVTRVQLPPAGSAAVEAQARVGPGVRVVAAFQNVAAAHLADLGRDIGCDVLVCGDDADAKALVLDLVRATGAVGYDAGPLANASVTEGLTSVLIGINKRHPGGAAGVRIANVLTAHPAGPHADVAPVPADAPRSADLPVLPPAVTLHPLTDLPPVRPGDDLAALVLSALARAGLPLAGGDVLVVAQKVVSKAEGRLVDLATVVPSPEAERLGAVVGKDPRLVEVILSESRAVVRAVPGVLIIETRLGFVCANAGVDHSNVGAEGQVALLPVDPDASARRLRAALAAGTGADVAVIINDSHGRPWREGTVGVAVGAAGIAAVADMRGRADLFGRVLRATTVGVIDELAAAASLLMGQSDEGVPVVLVRGARFPRGDDGARAVQRDPGRDLFR
jgi:coenzyme F420-0:L-glutamate ligase / coenzyme F420-1:gamma-L-glutamate ligase